MENNLIGKMYKGEQANRQANVGLCDLPDREQGDVITALNEIEREVESLLNIWSALNSRLQIISAPTPDNVRNDSPEHCSDCHISQRIRGYSSVLISIRHDIELRTKLLQV